MRKSVLVVTAFILASHATAAPAPNPTDQLSKDVASCLLKARAAMGTSMGLDGHPDNERIDAYAAQGKIYFNNPWVDQTPTFAFWKCLRLKGYNIPG